jgi:hypothetical protein
MPATSPSFGHVRSVLTALVATVALTSSPAYAQGGCSIDPLNCASGTGYVAGPQPGHGQGLQLGKRHHIRVTPGNAQRTRRARPGRSPTNGRRCSKVGRTKTCTYYRHGKASKVCVRRGSGKQHCRKAKRVRSSAITSAATSQGFLARTIRQVGKIWKNGRGHCTGTLIARGIILTAGHCLYVNAEVARESNYTLPQGYVLDQGDTLEFTPNSAWNGTVPILETDSADAETVYAPDHVWRITRSYVPQCFADNNMQCDYGLAELEPSSNGGYVGDDIGYWPIRTEMAIPLGAHFYDVGYSASGVFRTGRNGYGNAQYFCDVSWQGEYFSDANVTSGGGNLATDNLALTQNTYNGCQHMGGASGGPVFIEMSDGSWVVNGVNSSGPSNGQWGFLISWNYFGREMTNLYCYVIGCAYGAQRGAVLPRVAGSPGQPHPSATRR